MKHNLLVLFMDILTIGISVDRRQDIQLGGKSVYFMAGKTNA